MDTHSTDTKVDNPSLSTSRFLGKNHLTNPPSYGEILRFAVPLIFGFVMMTLHTIIDTLFIGQLGTAQLAAVPLAGTMYFIGVVLLQGVSQNSIAFLGKAFGAKEYHKMGIILAHYQWLALLGFPLLFLFIQSWPLFSAIGGLNAAVDGYAWIYLKIRVLDSFFFLLLTLYVGFYLSIGNSLLPMVVMVGGLFMNVILDYGLIFGKLGMPALGVAGSALATVLTQATGALILTTTLFVSRRRTHFNLRVFAPLDKALFKKILRIGLPQGMGSGLDTLMWVIFFLIVGQLGEIALAANNIGVHTSLLLSMPIMAIGNAAMSYTSRFLGASQPNYARVTTYRILKLATIYTSLLGILLWFFGETIAQAFNSNKTVVYQAGLLFKIVALYIIFNGVNTILRMALNGAGDTLIPTLLMVSCAIGVLFPMAILLSQQVGLGLVGAWLGAFIYTIVLAAMMVYRYRSDKWTAIL